MADAVAPSTGSDLWPTMSYYSGAYADLHRPHCFKHLLYTGRILSQQMTFASFQALV